MMMSVCVTAAWFADICVQRFFLDLHSAQARSLEWESRPAPAVDTIHQRSTRSLHGDQTRCRYLAQRQCRSQAPLRRLKRWSFDAVDQEI